MKHQYLHEIAKFASGLVLGDLLCGWWLATHNGLPFSFIGVTFTQTMVWPWMIFDIALFIILIHYGWNVGKSPLLKQKSFLLLTGTIFGIVAIMHLLRLFAGASLIVAGWDAPLWLSWIGTAGAAYLSYMSFHMFSRAK
jgi:hypothetical protein